MFLVIFSLETSSMKESLFFPKKILVVLLRELEEYAVINKCSMK